MNAARSRRPIVGMTTYLQQAVSGVWDVPASFLPDGYITAVSMAGGIGVLLPPQDPDESVVQRVLDRIDCLVVTGGRDVDPALYSQAPHPNTDAPATDRDAWETALITGALQRTIPLLGICRGAQILNVALGGTLLQHLPDVVGHSRHQPGPAVFATSEIRTVPGTRVGELLGPQHHAQCYHHQAIDRVAAGLIVSARDDEGVIEAVEADPVVFSGSWVVGVQWHPEQDLADLRLVSGLVAAAHGRAIDSRTSPTPAASAV